MDCSWSVLFWAPQDEPSALYQVKVTIPVAAGHAVSMNAAYGAPAHGPAGGIAKVGDAASGTFVFNLTVDPSIQGGTVALKANAIDLPDQPTCTSPVFTIDYATAA